MNDKFVLQNAWDTIKKEQNKLKLDCALEYNKFTQIEAEKNGYDYMIYSFLDQIDDEISDN